MSRGLKVSTLAVLLNRGYMKTIYIKNISINFFVYIKIIFLKKKQTVVMIFLLTRSKRKKKNKYSNKVHMHIYLNILLSGTVKTVKNHESTEKCR